MNLHVSNTIGTLVRNNKPAAHAGFQISKSSEPLDSAPLFAATSPFQADFHSRDCIAQFPVSFNTKNGLVDVS